MSILKNMLGGTLLLISVGMMAQSVSSANPDVMTSTKKVTVTEEGVSTGEKKTVYRLKIVEKRESPIAFETKDKGKIDQDRKLLPTEVTKIVYLDNDADQYYDKYIVIKHYESFNNKFKLMPTKNGLGLDIDGKVTEISKAGYYLTDANDNDYFIVEEFKSM